MKKNLFFVAVAALALTACSSDNEATQSAPQLQSGPQAIAFDTYVPEVTRAGDAGVQTTSTLQASGKGFGVFAVQSDNTVYAATQTTNFMWNEHVTYSSSAWGYSPLKYWPNETDNDSQSANAESNNIDRLSFFAYAPYVAEKSSTYDGSLTGVTYEASPGNPTKTAHNATSAATNVGILGVNANDENSVDPFVWYKAAPKPSESVDLLWGVAPAGGLSYTSVAAGLDNTSSTVANIASGTVTVAEGMPLVDLIKPVKDEKIKFLFKHALARLGVTVVAAIDQISAGGNLDAATHIAVESIKIEADGTNKLYQQGRLNLKNTTANQALWEEKSDPVTALTINSSSELSDEIRWDTDPATTLGITGFNGVDKTERKAMRTGGTYNADPVYFMLIPSHAATDVKVTITYYVFTADAKLNHATYGHYAVTKNVIDKTISIPALTNNKAYNLKLILGLTSVKLDAEVADWETAGSTPVDLPQNKD